MRYVKDISRPLLEFAIDFNNIDKNSKVDKIKNKVYHNLFSSGMEAAYDLLKLFCSKAKSEGFIKIFNSFVPVVDYDYSCFKRINHHYLDYIKKKWIENCLFMELR